MQWLKQRCIYLLHMHVKPKDIVIYFAYSLIIWLTEAFFTKNRFMMVHSQRIAEL